MDDESEFLFESAHLALRSNVDYLNLMKHLTVLCSLRIKVHHDIKRLISAKEKAINDPLLFVQELQSLDLPARNVIPEIPELATNFQLDTQSSLKEVGTSLDSEKSSSSTNFWTIEEQKKLEKLLHEFPSEAVESQRFAKISKAMGYSRTPKQIASRVQKFFKKLSEANLPIPGEFPRKSIGRRKFSRNNLKLDRPTTFFPERNISKDLLMKDSDDLITPNTESIIEKNDDQNKALQLLKQIREVKIKSITKLGEPSEAECCKCSEELYNGSSWRCDDCSNSSDKFFCSDCITSEIIKKNHLNVSLFDKSH